MGKLKRASAREQIRDSILKKIYDGTYAPGSRLREKELAEFFGTSQAPVREALRELEGMQCVVTYPYKGTLVKEVTIDDIALAYHLRGVFEQMAAKIICESGTRDWTELKEIAKNIELAAVNGDKEEFARYNVDFHKYIVRASGRSMLEHMWSLVSFQTQVQNAVDIMDAPLTIFSEEHISVIRALENGDGELAGSLLRDHADSVKNILIKKLKNTAE